MSTSPLQSNSLAALERSIHDFEKHKSTEKAPLSEAPRESFIDRMQGAPSGSSLSGISNSPLNPFGGEFSPMNSPLSGDNFAALIAGLIKDAFGGQHTDQRNVTHHGSSDSSPSNTTTPSPAPSTPTTGSTSTASTSTPNPASTPAAVSDPSKQPAMPSGNGYSEQKQPITLYPQGSPKASDVNQGGIGDCDVCAGLASLAANNPNVIKNAISDNGNGTYSVKMFDPNGKPITMQVDNTMLSQNGKYLGTKSKDGTANWSSIMEKAIAKYNTVYPGAGTSDSIDGLGGDGSEKTTGIFTGNFQTAAAGPGTLSSSDMGSVLKNAIASGDSITCGSSDLPTFGKDTVIGGHGYSVIGLTDQNGQTMVQVRNPWGTSATGADGNGAYDGSNDGVVSVPLDEFAKDFDIRVNAGPNGIGDVTPMQVSKEQEVS